MKVAGQLLEPDRLQTELDGGQACRDDRVRDLLDGRSVEDAGHHAQTHGLPPCCQIRCRDHYRSATASSGLTEAEVSTASFARSAARRGRGRSIMVRSTSADKVQEVPACRVRQCRASFQSC